MSKFILYFIRCYDMLYITIYDVKEELLCLILMRQRFCRSTKTDSALWEQQKKQ